MDSAALRREWGNNPSAGVSAPDSSLIAWKSMGFVAIRGRAVKPEKGLSGWGANQAGRAPKINFYAARDRLAREAEDALDGEEGDALREAEDEARQRAKS